MDQQNRYRTQSRENGPNELDRVREAARRDKKLRFTALLHHVTVDLLRDSYHCLKKQAAPRRCSHIRTPSRTRRRGARDMGPECMEFLNVRGVCDYAGP